MVHPYTATVAAGILPAVEPGRTARWILRAGDGGAGNPLSRTRTVGSLLGGGTHALRQARRPTLQSAGSVRMSDDGR